MQSLNDRRQVEGQREQTEQQFPWSSVDENLTEPLEVAHYGPKSTTTPHCRTDDWIGSATIAPCKEVRDLGDFIDADLTMRTHVQWTISRCFATLQQLCSIRRSVLTPVFQSLVVALVLSRLDYCNSLLINLPASLIQRLQSVQNAAVRLIFNIRRSELITDALISLHWLCVPEWIIFKVATLIYRAQQGTAPPYLVCQFTRVADMLSLIHISEPTRPY